MRKALGAAALLGVTVWYAVSGAAAPSEPHPTPAPQVELASGS